MTQSSPNVSNTPTIHELGSSRTKTGTYPTVVYSDVIVTTVPTAPPSSMSIPSSDPIDVVDPTVTLLTGPTGTTYTYGTHDFGHHPDYEPGHVSDSDDEIETMTANINPTNFRGTVSENADTWLRYLIKYCAYTRDMTIKGQKPYSKCCWQKAQQFGLIAYNRPPRTIGNCLRQHFWQGTPRQNL